MTNDIYDMYNYLNIQMLYKIICNARGIEKNFTYQIDDILISDKNDKLAKFCNVNFKDNELTITCTDGRLLTIKSDFQGRIEVKYTFDEDDDSFIKYTSDNVGDRGVMAHITYMKKEYIPSFMELSDYFFNENELYVLLDEIGKFARKEREKLFYKRLVNMRARRGNL
jgi:hypothetical protein